MPSSRITRRTVRRWSASAPSVPRHDGKGPQLFAAPPRIYKDSEDWILNIIASAEPDGYLVRNAEHLRFFKGKRLRGDYSLNVANPFAAEFFHSREGPRKRHGVMRPERRAARRRSSPPRRQRGSRSRSTSTCRSFTWSTASFAHS